jgi:hypothetical protein
MNSAQDAAQRKNPIIRGLACEGRRIAFPSCETYFAESIPSVDYICPSPLSRLKRRINKVSLSRIGPHLYS